MSEGLALLKMKIIGASETLSVFQTYASQHVTLKEVIKEFYELLDDCRRTHKSKVSILMEITLPIT